MSRLYELILALAGGVFCAELAPAGPIDAAGTVADESLDTECDASACRGVDGKLAGAEAADESARALRIAPTRLLREAYFDRSCCERFARRH